MRRHPSAADLPALLAKLCDAGVEFIIVGGAAAVIQGVPITITTSILFTDGRPRTSRACSMFCSASTQRCATTWPTEGCVLLGRCWQGEDR
jgi:hypothetical protein